jgi:hypothetical protein
MHGANVRAGDGSSNHPVLTPGQARALVRSKNWIEIRGRTIGREALGVLERAVAEGRRVAISNSTIDAELSLGAALAIPVGEEKVLPEIREFLRMPLEIVFNGELFRFGQAQTREGVPNPLKIALVRGSMEVTDSIVQGLSVWGEGDRQDTPPATMFQGRIELLRNTFLDCDSGFINVAFLSNPHVARNKCADPGAASLTFLHCWFRGHNQPNDYADNNFGLSFIASTFKGWADFTRTTFVADTSFEIVNFQQSAMFDGAVFQGFTNFTAARFLGPASFEGVQFKDFAAFDITTVSSLITFRGASFTGASFSGWFLSNRAALDFSYARSQGRLLGLVFEQVEGPMNRLYEAGLGDSPPLLQTHESDPESLTQRGRDAFVHGKAQFLSQEELKGVRSVLRQEHATALRLLEENSRILGLKDDALRIYRQRKIVERESRPWYFSVPEFALVDLTCGYGTQPWRLLAVVLIIILLFGFLYLPFKISVAQRVDRGDRGGRWGESLLFSLHTFMRVGYGGWHPKETRRYITLVYPVPVISLSPARIRVAIGRARMPLTFHFLSTVEGTLGWFSLAMFIATLARVWVE